MRVVLIEIDFIAFAHRRIVSDGSIENLLLCLPCVNLPFFIYLLPSLLLFLLFSLSHLSQNLLLCQLDDDILLFLHLPITIDYGRLSILIEIDLVELFEVLKVVSVHYRIDLLLIHLSQVGEHGIVFEKVLVCEFVLISLLLQQVLNIIIHVVFS